MRTALTILISEASFETYSKIILNYQSPGLDELEKDLVGSVLVAH